MSHRHLRILAILAIMLAGSLGALQSPDMSSPASAQESQDEAIITLPVRWCAVEGSLSARMAENDPNSINDVLLERQARANDRIWLPGAEIMFRSAFTAPMIDHASFPIISDPIPPDEGGHGDLGDIFDPREEFKERVQDNDVEGASELSLAIASCRHAWDELETNAGETEPTTPLMGPIALNIGRFVDENDNPTQTLGWGGYTTWEPKTSHPCFTPSGAKTAGDGYLAVVDVSVLENVITTDPELAELQLDLAQVDAALLAHEFGHVLYLSHGNGEDDDGNEFYDQRCDPWELPPATAETVMHAEVPEAVDVITPLQRGTSRDMATIYVGSQKLLPSNHNATPAPSPAGTPENQSILSDQRADMAGDVDAQAASVDLTYVELALNESQGTITLTQGIAGLIGPEETNAYIAFLDVDEDESGDVSNLELPSHIADEELQAQLSELALDSQPEGIDLVTMVVVDKDRNATVTVWRLNGGEFIVEPDANVDVQLTSPEGGEEPIAVSDVVTTTLPSAIIDTIQEQEQKQVGIKTVAANGQDFDVLQRFVDNDPFGELAILLLEPPAFPSCEVMNGQVNPGETADLEVTGFGTTDQGVLISLGDQVLADGSLDGEISTLEFAIPEDAQEGLRLVTVRLGDTALTADCAIQIGEPVSSG